MAAVRVTLHKVVTDVLRADVDTTTEELDRTAQRMFGCEFSELGHSEQADVVLDIDEDADSRWDWSCQIGSGGTTVEDVEEVTDVAA